MAKESTLPVDPDVQIPKAVREAAAKADAHYAAPVPDQAQLPLEPAQTAPVVPDQVQPPAPAPVPQAPPVPPAPPEPPNFEHQYNSMKGRYDSAQRTIGAMQEQMQQLGDELMRTQQVMVQNVNRNPDLRGQVQPGYITEDDVKNYGPDLIDLQRRAALEAVTPALSALQQENQQLRQAVQQQRTQSIYEKLDESMPNWREVNDNQRWRQWLRLRDFNSSPVRQEQLNRAMQAADAPRVVAFFNRFLEEEVATGQMPAPQPSQPPSEPRVAAIPLMTLAAPGRPNPATGNSQVPDTKPIWSHQEIRNFYDAVRTGYFNGREADKQRIEVDMFAAQREGRVR